MANVQLMQGDCLELMKDIPDRSIDCVICDLPFETSRNSWDKKLPLDKLWEQYNRITKENAAIILNCQQPFTSELIMSNVENFKYCWIWCKSNSVGFLNAKKQPLRMYGDIAVFYRKQCTYNPQMRKDKPYNKGIRKANCTSHYGNFDKVQDINETGERYPINILRFPNVNHQELIHPSQKPVSLLEYLIKTYTNEGNTVLDNCCGSGSTGIACLKTDRNFIGMEMNKDFFEIAKSRIENAQNALK